MQVETEAGDLKVQVRGEEDESNVQVETETDDIKVQVGGESDES